ncbi:DUF1403 family protein [Ochrobactrum sp. SFR4]|uniref:DUF1403 family protein n=1 Tax=Ochrobactrum sp. SFR4 TaxID=2717368 RepID=UPI00336A1CDF
MLPTWAQPNPADGRLEGALFAAAIALKSLDDLVRLNPVWLGCFRARQALVCARAACQWLRLNADEGALRDAVLLAAPGGDPGPAGRVLAAYHQWSKRRFQMSSTAIRTLGTALGLSLDADSAVVVETLETVLQTCQPPPLAAARLITALYQLRPDVEILGWMLADGVIATKLGWPTPVPLLLSARFHPVLRLNPGRGRLRPDDPDFTRVVCLALVTAIQTALNSANALTRRTATLLAEAPHLRTKGADRVIRMLLNQECVFATAPDSGLSRWAASRLMTRLEQFGAVREMSGRSSFKIYGL